MPRYLKVLLWLLSGLVLLVAICMIVIATMDWNRIKPWANRQLSDLAHRPVQIEGDLDVDWQRSTAYDGWRGLVPWPLISAKDITIGNPSWATVGPTMVQAKELRALLDPLALTQHVLRLADLQIDSGQLALERRMDGVNNWTFGTDDQAKDPSGWQVDLERLELIDASARLLDAPRVLDVTAHVTTMAQTSDQGYGTQWKVDGSYHEVPVSGEGKLGNVLLLRNGGEPFPVQGSLHVGGTTIAAEGTVTQPSQLAALDLQFELAGPTMADLYPVLGVALPNTPPYQTKGHLKGKLQGDEDVWSYENFTGTVGKSDLEGSLTYAVRDPRPLLTGHLQSKLLRFKDLGPLVGAETAEDVPVPPVESENGKSADAGESAGGSNSEDPEGQVQAPTPSSSAPENGDSDEGRLTEKPEQPAADKALPVEKANTNIWSTMDADVTFKGQRIVSNIDLPLDDIDGHVVLKDSILTFQPLNFGVAGGTLNTTITLNGKGEVIEAALKAKARGLQLGQLFPGTESMDAALGSVHGDADLTGRGNSVSALMDHASGELRAVVSKGTISHFLLEAAGLNVANMVMVKLFGDEQVMLECVAAEFAVNDGLVQTQTFVLETNDAVVTVDGQINLASEKMDLDIRPENKSLRIFTLRSPLYVRGTFKDPDVGVQKGPIAARAGAAVALGVVATPLAALLPLLNVGTDDATHCAIAGKGGEAVPEADDNGRLKGSVPGAEPQKPVEP